MIFIWLSIIVMLAFLEFINEGLTTIWFVLSGILALILSLFIDSFLIQFAIFIFFGILFLLFLKPLVEKYLRKNKK